MPTSAVLFCPFCGESFEDLERCPDHDIPLITFDELERLRREAPDDDQPLPYHEVRFGRGPLFVAGVLVLFGFVMPFVEVAHPQGVVRTTGFATAATLAMNFWVVPATAVMLVSIAIRRRTRAALRAARLAVVGLVLLGAASVGLTLYRIHAGAGRVAQAYREEVPVTLLSGFWVCAIALTLALFAGVTLGRAPRTKQRYRV
ncbi:MAG: hypothetical protein KF901_23680 [Myxococcales bacterium]|nr:hypothetical protein [Myxococcales bacterium]